MNCTYTHAHARHTAKSARHLFFLCVLVSLSRVSLAVAVQLKCRSLGGVNGSQDQMPTMLLLLGWGARRGVNRDAAAPLVNLIIFAINYNARAQPNARTRDDELPVN